MAQKENYIRGFDALRAFSVLLVILSHTGISAMASSLNPVFAGFFSIFTGNYGVKTFFVLSGFLITSNLMSEHALNGHIDVRKFIAHRALRILPLYFLILFLAITLAKLGIAQWAGTAYLYSLFYVYNFVPNAQGVNYLNHLWSLAVEEQFYVVWPFVFGMLFSRTRAMINAFAVGVILICFWRMTSGYGDWVKTHTPSMWTIPAIYPISIGCIVALNISTVQPYLRTSLSLVASLALIFGSLIIPYSPGWEIISTFGIAGVIAWVYLNQSNRFVQNMDWGVIGILGQISYGLYMWQGFLTGNGSYRAVPNWPPNIWVGAALTFPAAYLSFKYFEAPIRAYGKRRLTRRAQAAE